MRVLQAVCKEERLVLGVFEEPLFRRRAWAAVLFSWPGGLIQRRSRCLAPGVAERGVWGKRKGEIRPRAWGRGGVLGQ